MDHTIQKLCWIMAGFGSWSLCGAGQQSEPLSPLDSPEFAMPHGYHASCRSNPELFPYDAYSTEMYVPSEPSNQESAEGIVIPSHVPSGIQAPPPSPERAPEREPLIVRLKFNRDSEKMVKPTPQSLSQTNLILCAIGDYLSHRDHLNSDQSDGSQ